ncbi:MAG TPA: hypothetical protein VGE05_09635 [Novosphingobium sp.]
MTVNHTAFICNTAHAVRAVFSRTASDGVVIRREKATVGRIWTVVYPKMHTAIYRYDNNEASPVLIWQAGG